MMTKTKADKYPQRVRNELRFRELTVLRVERAGAAFQRIVLGGGVSKAFPRFEKAMRAGLADFVFPQAVDIRTEEVAYSALIGAASLVA